LTVVLLQKFAEAAARLIPQWEIIDYAHDDKVDAPSGTARELAYRLSKVRSPVHTVPLEKTVGPRETRGATVSGSQVHSLRLPGYVISAEIIFGMPDQRLSIRHDSGGSARPYVDGALLAIRKVSTLTGVHRGLDTVLDLPGGTFQGAGVKTVVLFFEKGAPTRKVWFYQLDPGRNFGKTNALNDNDLAEFVKLQKTHAHSPKSWSLDTKSINQMTFDLSVKNPNGGDEVKHRSPQEIMEEIAALDDESADVLGTIKALL
jgi:hypothetical protein